MSCSICTKSYSFLTKEKACESCGFGVCSGCLVKKEDSVTKKKKLICKSCVRKEELQEAGVKPSVREPPFSSLARRIEQLAEPPIFTPSNPIGVIAPDNSKIRKLKRGLSKEDMVIVERLEKLKNDRKLSENLPSDSEMAERLAKLKGEPVEPGKKEQEVQGQTNQSSYYVAPDNRSDQQREEDLVKTLSEELKIDQSKNVSDDEATEEIARRLARLKNLDDTKITKEHQLEEVEELEELPSDEEADKLVKQLMEEQAIEENKGDDTMNFTPSIDIKSGAVAAVRQASRVMRRNSRDSKDNDEELPWCVICNNDATLRCTECEDDLYCQRCFKECHGEFEEHHEPTKYVKKNKQ